MKVALIGASGKAGSRVLSELVNRGHTVTGIGRNPQTIAELPNVTRVGVDGSGHALTEAVRGHDAVVSAARFADLDPDILVPAIVASGTKRYVVVGGAGSLILPNGIEEAKSPDFPEPFRLNSLRGGYLLEVLRNTPALEWTYISPSRFFRPGERTGKFRYGKDHMLFDAEGVSSISFEDFALALVDELEKPAHSRERFTIGY